MKLKSQRLIMKALTTFFILSLLFGPGHTTATAQKKGTKTRKVLADNEKDANEKILQFMQDYRFDEASELIKKEITTAQRAQKPTASLDTQLKQAQDGAEMLQGTERVTFVDSLVVNKDDFWKYFQLNPECGNIAPPRNLCSGLNRRTGKSAHMNELKDMVYFSAPDSSGRLKIFSMSALGNGTWGSPQPLAGIGESGDIQDFPYMMPDGITLYYAAQGNGSIGGYDIFVTRYNPETRKFVKAENIGMPFNSPANDYLYVIDEATRIGWFVTDRNQPADKVCIYRFIPNESRDIYDTTTDESLIRRAARLHSVAESQTDKKAVQEALKRIGLLQKQTRSGEQPKHNIRIVINDRLVYNSLQQFKSDAARRIASEWLKENQRLIETDNQLEHLRAQYASTRSQAAKEQIIQAEKIRLTLATRVETLAKNMRRAEMQ